MEKSPKTNLSKSTSSKRKGSPKKLTSARKTVISPTRTVKSEQPTSPKQKVEENLKNISEAQKELNNSRFVKEKIISVLDHLDSHVSNFRAEALNMAKKRDFLLTCVDLLKTDETLDKVNRSQKHSICDYSKQLSLAQVKISTLRSVSQEESLSQVNTTINSLIAIKNAAEAKKRCEILLNTCCGVKNENCTENEHDIIDRNFELLVLGCSLDDQKEIKERLKSLLTYIKEKESEKVIHSTKNED